MQEQFTKNKISPYRAIYKKNHDVSIYEQFTVYTNISQKSQNTRAKWSLSVLVSEKYNNQTQSQYTSNYFLISSRLFQKVGYNESFL